MPHGSFEVESGSRQHHIDVVTKHPCIEVPAEPVVRLHVADDRLYTGTFAAQLVLLSHNGADECLVRFIMVIVHAHTLLEDEFYA